MESTGEVVSPTTGSDGSDTVVKSNAPSDFHIASRSEPSNPPPPPPPTNLFTSTAPPLATENFSIASMKKKRGRPRKFRHDGSPVALSPNPISTAAPTTSQVIDFSASETRDKLNPTTTSSFFRTKYQVDNLGEWSSPSSSVANFTPHIITVNAGEDVTKKIISFSQQGSLAICVLCANGVVSSVTLRKPDSSCGTLTYEGRFEILSLSRTFMPSSDSDGTRSRTGGMCVSLSSHDGRVLGGGVAGLLVAATPIQVVLGSFLAGTNQQDQKPKMQSHSFTPSPMPSLSNAYHHRINRPMSSSTLKISTWTPPFVSDPRNKPSRDINMTLT
ncbi:unnamed protein product [Cochlearia groenlandica]